MVEHLLSWAEQCVGGEGGDIGGKRQQHRWANLQLRIIPRVQIFARSMRQTCYHPTFMVGSLQFMVGGEIDLDFFFALLEKEERKA